ncbi:hypothetical protein J3458_013154 [Metarhizium acridum]|uniref:uncharacterized protein n=1 Tax=Metarhizium acridum TaxID=92637 RepID=UPI001C6AAD57|nr:hypothetical protein J3458_013154 [Metarhizium acridum]
MESKLYEFLHDHKNEPWFHMLTPSSIRGLAQAALESTDEFLSSKFTLRGRIVSLYANSRTHRKIHPLFDEAMATLGVPLEDSLDDMSPFLAAEICSLVHQWVPDPDQVAAEQTLLSLAVPDRQFEYVLGNAHAARILLNHGADPMLVWDKECRSTLMSASNGGHVDVIELLLSEAPSLLRMGHSTEALHDLGSKQLCTPLIMASLTGHWKAVTTLLNAGADPDPDTEHEEEGGGSSLSPLCLASLNGWLQTSKALLENGADVNRPGAYNEGTALWCAANFAASVPCCRALLAHGADTSTGGLPLMIELVTSSISKSKRPTEDIIPVLEVFVGHSPPLDINETDANGSTALMHERRKCWGCGRRGQSPLSYAVEASRFDVVEELLNWKPKPIQVTATVLQRAFEGGDLTLLERLLEAGADPDSPLESGRTLMRLAIQARNAHAVEMLIKWKADINRLDKFRWSPLYYAVGQVHDAKIARLLVDCGANASYILPDTGRNLMHMAMEADSDIIRILFEFPKAVDIDHRDHFRNTPLMMVNNPKADCVSLSVKAGADTNAQNSDGATPLMNAVTYWRGI